MKLPNDVTIQVDDEIRLDLRKPEHEKLIYPAIDANRMFLSRWVWWANESYSEADLSERNEKFQDEYKLGEACLLDVFVNDEFAGTVDAHNIRQGDSAEIGYWLIEKFTGRGLASRAMKALIEYVHNTYKANYLYIETDGHNLASKKLAERLGFTFEQTSQDNNGSKMTRYGLRLDDDGIISHSN